MSIAFIWITGIFMAMEKFVTATIENIGIIDNSIFLSLISVWEMAQASERCSTKNLHCTI